MPIEFKKYFWDADFNSIDIEKNKQHIIARLFTVGNQVATDWIKENYTEEEIVSTIKESRQFNTETADSLSSEYNVPKNEMKFFTNIHDLGYNFN